MVKPMIRMNTPRIGHVQEIEIGPPLLKPAPKVVKQPARIEMIENEMAKFEKPDQERCSSCLYPSSASRRSSSLSEVVSAMAGKVLSEAGAGRGGTRGQSSRITSSSSRGRSGPSNSAT